ncbi:hypothetical protein [Streptomyces sp. NPDC058953]|uniref:hypothetical protein n=1 Tax=unclassified Streptomyces TaxID=2593676 RepID=UPI0036992FDE
MTRDALTTEAPEPFDAVCVHCTTQTLAPVEVGVIERIDGPAVVLYACPRCVVRCAAGPTPDEDISP